MFQTSSANDDESDDELEVSTDIGVVFATALTTGMTLAADAIGAAKNFSRLRNRSDTTSSQAVKFRSVSIWSLSIRV